MTPMKRGLLLVVVDCILQRDLGPKDDPDEKGIVTKKLFNKF